MPSSRPGLVVAFTQSQRAAYRPVGSGITDLRIIRPGYPADTKQIFTNELLNPLKPFSTLCMMGRLNINANPGYYGDPGHHALHWADRHTLDNATQ